MSTDVETVQAVEWMLEAAGRLGRTVTRLPSPSPGEILVTTRLGAISPGTERTLLHGNSPFVQDTQYPYQPGYLNIGFYGETEEFIAALREGRRPSPSAEEAVDSVALAAAVQDGREIEFTAR